MKHIISNFVLLLACLLLSYTASAQVNYYWNGGNSSASPAAGGAGTWDNSTLNWLSPTNTGTATSIVNDGQFTNAFFNGTAGNINLYTTQSFSSANFNTSGDTISTKGIVAKNLNGPITLASNVTLYVEPDTLSGLGGIIGFFNNGVYGNVTGSGTANLTLIAAPDSLSPGRAHAIEIGQNIHINVPVNINANTSLSNNTNVAGLFSAGVGAQLNGNITNNTTEPVMLGVTTNSSYYLTFSGVLSGATDLHICSAPATGAGSLILTNNNTYTGNTCIDGGSVATQKLRLGINNALPITTGLTIGFSTTANTGGVFDLNGYNQTIASLATNTLTYSSGKTYVGSVTNSATNTTSLGSQAANSVLTISGPASTAFNLTITNGTVYTLALVRAGLGTTTLGFKNSFTGGTKITGGALSISIDSNLGGIPASPASNLTLNGGKLITTASFTLSSNRTIALGPTSGTGNNDTISVTSGTLTYAGQFINNGGTGGLVKAGIDTLLLNGATASTFTGALNVAAGVLKLNPGINNIFGSSTVSAPSLVMDGGYLSTSGIASTRAILFNTLALNDHSAIILSGTNAHSIYFAASSGATWTSGKKLVIAGWTGGYNGTAGTTGRIYVGSSIGDISTSQIAQILFYDGTYYYTATQITGGEIVPWTVYPFTDYYSGASGNLDATGTWSTKLYPNAGGIPSSFTAGNQVFHIDNGSTGAIGGGSWTVSGISSFIAVDQSTDLTINATRPITATINVGAGRTLTINNSTYPTLGTLAPTATINYGGSASAIPSTQTTFPNLKVSANTAISANTTVSGTLIMNGGNLNLNGDTLTINDISGASASSAITGSATSGLVINGNTTGTLYFDQTSASTATLGTFTVNGNATIGNRLNIAAGSAPGVVTVAAGVILGSSGNLTLRSDINGTARIGTVGTGGVISGSVNAERFNHAQRGYRIISHPYAADQDITSLSSYLDITGLTGGNIGSCPSAAASTFSYDPSTPRWAPITATGTGTFPAASTSTAHGNGILAMIRGAKGEGCYGGSYTPSTNTFVTSGSVNIGSTSLQEAIAAGKWNLIGDPLPSPIILGNVGNIGLIDDNVYLVNPSGQVLGANINSTQYLIKSISSDDPVIPMNGGFLAHNSSGSTITLNFPEQCKTGNSSLAGSLFKTTGLAPTLELTVMNGQDMWDNWQLNLKPHTSGLAGDNGDIMKLSNAQFDIYSFSTDSISLARDARDADSLADGDIITLGIRSAPQLTYNLTVTKYDLPTNKDVYLHDKYTNTYLILGAGVTYPLTISNDPLSQGKDRLELLINDLNSTTGIGNLANHATGVVITPNPATSNITLSYSSILAGDKTICIVNTMGQLVKQLKTGENTFTISIADLASGIYIIRTTVGANSSVDKFIKN